MSDFPKLDLWFLDCSTGCSCCSGENFTAGPFKTREDAEQRAASYAATARLASQYTKTGYYYVSGPEKGELLPDGRIICTPNVFDADSWGHERCR